MRRKSRRGFLFVNSFIATALAFAGCGRSNPPSPFALGKVQLDLATMLADDPEFASANPRLSEQLELGAPTDTAGAARVQIPQGTRFTVLLRNNCRANSEFAFSETSAVIADMDEQAYSLVLARELTLADLEVQAEANPCVIGISNETRVMLDPVAPDEPSALVDASAIDSIDATMTAPNDPRFSAQKFMETIKAGAAFDIFYDSSKNLAIQPVVIAIVDTGIDYRHPDLAPNIWNNAHGDHGYDFVNKDTAPLDDDGHGTHVAGLAAAVRDNRIGISGVMGTNARLMAIKVLDGNGSGSSTDVVNGIKYATKNGADVINLSLGSLGTNSTLRYAIQTAVQSGVTVLAAAGNSNTKLSSSKWQSPPSYAKDIAGFISIGSINSVSLAKSNFSNYSPYGYVEIAAPGSNGILSTIKGGGYGYKAGTSMASPIAAGAAALAINRLRSRGYSFTPATIENLIRDSGVARASLKNYFAGGKILNLYNLARLIDSRYPRP